MRGNNNINNNHYLLLIRVNFLMLKGGLNVFRRLSVEELRPNSHIASLPNHMDSNLLVPNTCEGKQMTRRAPYVAISRRFSIYL